jgi:hypothetical protein
MRDKTFVQIMNVDERKAVKFGFGTAAEAEALERELNDVFARHGVNCVIGSFADGETCPVPEHKRDWKAWTSQPSDNH